MEDNLTQESRRRILRWKWKAPPLEAYEWGVVLAACVALGVTLSRASAVPLPELMVWVGIIALVELAPVQHWRLQMSLGYPVMIGIALLYPPAIAAAVAAIGSFDPRELRREIRLVQSLFNRAQVCLSIMAASAMFHWLSGPMFIDEQGLLVALAAAASVFADFFVNVALVGTAVSISEGMKLREVLPRFLIGNRTEFLVSYLGLGALGVVMAKLYLEIGFWSVALFVAPLFLARQMFFRSQALEEAHRELQEREALLESLSERLAAERQEERLRIAEYLHDDLAQLLFQLSLQADLTDRYIEDGDIESARKTLSELRHTKSVASERMRSLVQDLHRSPLGRKGLADALASFAEEMERDSTVRFAVDTQDLQLGPPIQLIVYQIAHEAVMNSMKYAEPSEITIGLHRKGPRIELIIRDDGSGFDAEADGPDGHFGLTMMRERAAAVGGTFDIVSAAGHGTAITVTLPASWLQSGGVGASPPRAATPTPRPEASGSDASPRR